MTLDIALHARSDTARARAALAAPPSFGATFTDLMLTVHHDVDRGWHDAAIVPYGPLAVSPAAKVLHYGMEIFEGHKAYRWPDGEVALFRAELNAARLNRSARRLRLPEVPQELQRRGTEMLVDLVRAWVPPAERGALYVRPTLIATEGALGIKPSRSHLYFVIASPVGTYFAGGLDAISVHVEREHVRAVVGGVGDAKTGGNYAAGLDAQVRAVEAGHDQVLFLDALEHRYVEELHGMAFFMVEDGVLVTPPLGGTILPSITRRTILELGPDLGLETVEKPIDIDALVAGVEAGRVTELMAVGTAAVVTSIGRLGYRGAPVVVGDGGVGPVVRAVHAAVTDVQYGRAPDRHGWMRVVPRDAEAGGGVTGSGGPPDRDAA